MTHFYFISGVTEIAPQGLIFCMYRTNQGFCFYLSTMSSHCYEIRGVIFTWWPLWVPSNLGYAVILWFLHLLFWLLRPDRTHLWLRLSWDQWILFPGNQAWSVLVESKFNIPTQKGQTMHTFEIHLLEALLIPSLIPVLSVIHSQNDWHNYFSLKMDFGLNSFPKQYN